MRKLFAFISGATLLLSVGLGNAPAARAGSKCTNVTLIGEFGSQLSGTIVAGGPAPAGPFAGVGVLNFDGKGNVSGSDTVSFNGTMAVRTLSGTYNVKGDCTVMVELTDSLGGSATLSGIIVKNGKEILTVVTEPPYTAITGIQKKVE